MLVSDAGKDSKSSCAESAYPRLCFDRPKNWMPTELVRGLKGPSISSSPAKTKLGRPFLTRIHRAENGGWLAFGNEACFERKTWRIRQKGAAPALRDQRFSLTMPPHCTPGCPKRPSRIAFPTELPATETTINVQWQNPGSISGLGRAKLRCETPATNGVDDRDGSRQAAQTTRQRRTGASAFA
jgi:hypothetical protein